MHEVALADGILQIVTEAAGGEEISKILIQVGRLQHVTQESIQFAFELLAEGSPAANAVIEIQEIPALFRCRECGETSDLKHPPYQCPACSCLHMEVVTGEEITVDSVHLTNGTTIRKGPLRLDDALVQHMKEEHGH